MAKNSFAGKYMEGTFSNGEGPVMGQTTNYEKEDKGLISGGEGGGKNLTQNSGPTTVVPPTPSGDRLFDVQGKGYSGPENWKPTDQGTTNPYEIGKS